MVVLLRLELRNSLRLGSESRRPGSESSWKSLEVTAPQSSRSEFPNTICLKCDQPLKNSNSWERKPLSHRESVAQMMMPSRVVTDNVTIYKSVWAQALTLRCRDGVVVCHGITYVKEGRSFLGVADRLSLIRNKRFGPI